MTVAAVILAPTPESALADAEGTPVVRRLVDTAWAGGAVPLVIIGADPDGSVARALAGTPVTLAEPAPAAPGSAAQVVRGIEVALDRIREIDAALVWPVRYGWVGAETVTSLIEAHGAQPERVLRPAHEGEPGWPVLVPLANLATLRTVDQARSAEDVVAIPGDGDATAELVDLGDPGVVHDISVARADLPPYTGPGEPASGHVHEWGDSIAGTDDDVPLEGPALAPYAQAVGADPDQPG